MLIYFKYIVIVACGGEAGIVFLLKGKIFKMRERKRKITQIIAGITAAVMALGTVVMSPGNDASKVLAWKYPYTYDSVTVDAAHFPDSVFRNYVSETFDQNGDGKLDNDELMEARNIWCDKLGIYTLDGIEYLPELRGIYASFNHLSELDISKNQLITGIWVSNNDFTSLDFSQNPGLEWLYCFDCPKLTSLNVSGNPLMSYLEVNTCPLGSIDVSNNPLLEQLTCATCGLTELDLSNNSKLTHLDCQQNDIASLDLSHCPKMRRLDIWDNDKLNNVDISVCPELQYYCCASNNVTSLDLSHNPELGKLNCGWNNITSLDLSHNPELQFLMAFTNSMSSLNIADNPLLIETINKGTKQWEENANSYSYSIDYGIDDSYGGLDSKYFFCVDGNVSVNTSGGSSSSSSSYFEGDVSDTSNLLTREMVAQTLYTLAGSPDVSGLTSRFTDVEPGAWYYNAVLWGEKYNICLGFPYMTSDTFGVGKWCTKQEMVTMVMRYAEYMGYERSIDFGRSDDYIDYFDVSNSCWEGVCWAATYRILPVEGDGDKTQQRIYPYKVTTRSDLTYIINGLQEANKVTISSVPIPDASYLPSTVDTDGAEPGTIGGSTTNGSGSGGSGSGGSGSGGSGSSGSGSSGSGSSGSGSSGSSSSNKGKWVQSDGKWYYYDGDGKKETNCYREGYWLKSDGSIDSDYCNGTWKYNGVGWWYEDGGWYPTSQWLKIDGKWYYFLADGYMDYGEYREGCWLNDDGSWDPNYGSGTWHLNSTGWWYSDGSWYPAGQYLWIDGYRYYFNSSGYWQE